MYSFPYKQIFFCISVFSLDFFFVKGSELDDFVSGPRELLLRFVEENYPLPEKPQFLKKRRDLLSSKLIYTSYTVLVSYSIPCLFFEGVAVTYSISISIFD